ncbi:hypothetical protein AB0M43_25660 [Longispora sp. NPDC051575]|uniref:hypothetical protein n=1 Tax=Longispora sp. NPDC051575 TaxID=3154943 RepID=UPI003442542D
MKIEERLAETLAAHAGGDVDTAALLARSTARGRSVRRRRHAGIALAAVAVLGVAVAVPVALWPARPAPTVPIAVPVTPSPSVSPSPTALAVPNLPPVTGQRTLAESPAVLGSDPALVHLAMDPLPLGLPVARSSGESTVTTRWASFPGNEYLSIGGTVGVHVYAGPWSADKLDKMTFVRDVVVAGKPGKLYERGDEGGYIQAYTSVSWEAMPGVPMVVEGVNGAPEATLLAVAGKLRYDRVGQCLNTMRVTAVPPGATLYRCDSTVLETGELYNDRRVYHGPAGATFEVHGGGPKFGPNPGETPNTTVAGQPAFWDEGTKGVRYHALRVPDWDGHGVSVIVTGSYGRAEAELVLTGLRWP